MRAHATTFMFFFFMAAGYAQTTWYVPDDFPGGIQDAISAGNVVNGDTIIVRKGVYFENLDFNGKAITVKGEFGPTWTNIRALNTTSVVIFRSGEDSNSVLDGFTLSEGTGYWTGGNETYGGGIFCQSASPTITNNIISMNKANYGGGICCDLMSHPIIENNRIRQNTAEPTLYSEGGGICCIRGSNPNIENNIIEDNTTEGKGGGIYCEGADPTIRKNTIRANHASSGGGIECYEASPHIDENLISGNSVYNDGAGIDAYASYSLIENNVIVENFEVGHLNWGGGIRCYHDAPTLKSNIIAHNKSDHGGGIYIGVSDAILENNMILNNSATKTGGGIYIDWCHPSITNTTISGNTASDPDSGGGGIYCYYYSSPKITNTIFWDNKGRLGPEIHIKAKLSPTFSIKYSDIMGGYGSVYTNAPNNIDWGPGMIDMDPLFVNPVDGDYHLMFHSPCKGAGDKFSAVPRDFEGDKRFGDGMVDMGADEFSLHLYCTGLATPGERIGLNITDAPGNSPIFLWGGFQRLESPVPSPYGDWYLTPPFSTLPLPGSIPSPGGHFLYTDRIPPDFPIPCEFFLQAFVESELTNLCTLTIRP